MMIILSLCGLAGLIMVVMLTHRLLQGPQCSHKWEVVVERELPAPVEILGKQEVANWPYARESYAAGRKKFYAILRCKECPKTREFSTLSGGEI